MTVGPREKLLFPRELGASPLPGRDDSWMSVSDPSRSPATTGDLSGAGRRVGEPEVAELVRRRRQQLHWSQSELARRSGVSRVAVNEIEGGRRSPSVRTYGKLREALGLQTSTAQALLPTAPPENLTQQYLTSLAACLISRRQVPLAELAAALGVSIPAIRQGLWSLRERLAACGLAASEDGLQVELVYLAHVSQAVGRLSELEVVGELSSEAIEVLLIVASLGEASRRQVEERRLQDCASLLERLVRRGLLAKRAEDEQQGQPNAYRLTTRAVARLGHASLDSLQAWCQEQLELHASSQIAPARPPTPAP